MESNAMFSVECYQPTATNHILEADQQQSYLPPHWSSSPIDLGLDDPQGHSFPIQGQSVEVPASEFRSSRSWINASPCSSESSRRHSQDDKSTRKQNRRRAQNRAAQRAYRERKDHLRHELESQVKEWQDKHQALRGSYVDQAQEVQQLKRTIEELQVQLSAMQDTRLPTHIDLSDFDMWPDFEWKAA